MKTALYELAGGEEGVYALSAAFYRRMLTDPLVLPLFAHPDDDHVGRMALFLSEYFGGPEEHTRQRGGHATMDQIHVGLKISNRQRDRWIEHMHAACEEVQLSDEFVQLFEPIIQRFADLAQSDSWH